VPSTDAQKVACVATATSPSSIPRLGSKLKSEARRW
jgi:hypothetical protein